MGKKRRKRRDSLRYPMRNKHHILPKSRDGGNEPENLLLLKVQKHQAFHYLFGDRTIEEAIELLLRVHRAKGRCTKALVGKCVIEELSCKSTERSQSVSYSTAPLIVEDTLRMKSSSTSPSITN
jgi:hypothetical protein